MMARTHFLSKTGGAVFLARQCAASRRKGLSVLVRPSAACCSSLHSTNIGVYQVPISSPPSWTISSSRAILIHPWRCFSSLPLVEEVSSTVWERPVRILYGSQGGTAQIFSMQLADAITEESGSHQEATTFGLNEFDPHEALTEEAINVILTSVAGVGEPPDTARAFYQWLMSDDASTGIKDWSKIHYTVFGLGNKKAHPHHYNVIGKSIDARLHELGAIRIHVMGLGDDGECIEDDFDVWQGHLVETLQGKVSPTNDAKMEATDDSTDDVVDAAVLHTKDGRIVSSKYPPLLLEPSESDLPRKDLLHLQPPFYQADMQKLTVMENHPLNVDSGEFGLREMVISTPNTTYEAGDHFLVYSQNAHCLVEAYLQLLTGVDPNSIVSSEDSSTYPHPKGITLFETLLHCVDLGAVPSPAFSRELLGHKNVNYKEEIAIPRRTVLDLALESGQPLAVEDLLYNLTPQQPRYYSIASSPLTNPHQVYLVYRPVKYVSSHGALREGTCTSYMSNLRTGSQIVGATRSNSTFRLPNDPTAPVLLIAGGCGVAPIRAFVEERLAAANAASSATIKFGEGHLFLGFRSPSDAVYTELIDRAIEKGVLSNVQIAYTSGATNRGLVSEAVREHGEVVWNLMQGGGYTYLCGGARTFGAAVEREVIDIIQKYGSKSEEDATQYLRNLIKQGRFCEDLAD